MNVSKLIPARYDDIEIYNPDLRLVEYDLSNSVSLWGTAPDVQEELNRTVSNDNLSLYPDIYALELKQVLAKYYSNFIDGVENIVVGNGSDEILDCVIRTATSEGDRVVVPTPSFRMPEYFAQANGREVISSVLLENGAINVDEIVSFDAKLVYVCTPNNPTAENVPKNGILELIQRFDGIVLIDEAFGEFSDVNCLEFLSAHENVIIARSMSKLYALAGLRIGYGFGAPKIIDAIHATRGPFKANSVGIAAAKISFTCIDWYEKIVEEVKDVRSWFISELEDLGYRVPGHDANFVYIEHLDQNMYADIFLENGYSVRWFPDMKYVGPGARVSIAPKEILEPFLSLIGKRNLRAD